MINKKPQISPKDIMDAISRLRALGDQVPQFAKDFVFLHPNVVAMYKTQPEFEPLSDYIAEVRPYDGEVGRYDADGTKIRIVEVGRLKYT